MANNTTLLAATQGKLAYLEEKIRVHSSNLVRSSIPGKKFALQLEPFKLEAAMGPNSKKTPNLAVTNSKHIGAGGKMGKTPQFKTMKSSSSAVSYSGNQISHQQELKEINEASIQHKEMVNLYTKAQGMMRIPFGTGNGG